MNILIKDNWALNLGDIAIAEAMISQMKSAFPDCKITLESSHPETAKKYFKDIKIIPRLFDVSCVKHAKKIYSFEFVRKNIPFLIKTFFTILSSYLQIALRKTRQKTLQTKNPTLKAYQDADLILSAGGDFITEEYAFFLRFYEISLIKKLGKPIILYAQSIGPFRKRNIGIASKYLNKVDAILARDKTTFDLLKSYNIKAPIFQTADAVILLEAKDNEKVREAIRKYQLDKNSVGFVVRDIKYTDIDKDDYEEYISGMKKLIKHIEKKGLRPIFIAPNPEDLKAEKMMNEKYNLNLKIIKTEDFAPGEIKEIFSKMKIIASARLHPTIIAATAGTPVIGIGKEFKMKNFLDLAGLEKYYLEMIPFEFEKAKILIDEILDDYSTTEEVFEKSVEGMAGLSEKNVVCVKEIFEKL